MTLLDSEEEKVVAEEPELTPSDFTLSKLPP